MDYRNSNHTADITKTLQALPKIELHRHLEGSIRLETLAAIAREFHLPLPGVEVADIRPLVQMVEDDPPDASTYLSKFGVLREFYRSPQVIDRIAYEAVADAAAEHIVYFELRFTPPALARARGYSLAEVTDWVIAATQRAAHDFGIRVGLILSMNRHEPVDLGHQVVEVAADRLDEGVVAVDLAGAEHDYPGEEFAPVFAAAREAGLHVTIHAGEWSGPESIQMAVERLGATRIGHGVRVVEDSDVLQMAREREIVFEVCPTSNVQSGVVRGYDQHPLRDMYQVGLVTTLNTDNTGVGGFGLTDEYVRAVTLLGLSEKDVRQMVLNAARAAFLPPQQRDRLARRIARALGLNEEVASAS
jgi:adenosine deaminase